MSKSYQDTRNKTIRWCDNLLRNGIYDREQYKECVNSFVDLSGGGKLPEPIRPPKTNNEYSYSLYGKDSNYTTKQLVDTETGKIYIKTRNNMFLCALENGEIRLSNGKDVIDYEHLEWRLVYQKNDEYLIQSHFEKFLTIKDDNRLMADINSMDLYSVWKIIKKDNYIVIESLKNEGERITADNTIKLTSGNAESQLWKIENVLTNNESVIQTYNDENDISEKNRLMNDLRQKMTRKYEKIMEIKMLIVCARELEHTYCAVINIIKNNINSVNSEFRKELGTYISQNDSSNNLIQSANTRPLSSILNKYKLPNSFDKNNYNSLLSLLNSNLFNVQPEFILNRDFPMKSSDLNDTCKNLFIGPTFPVLGKVITDKQAHAERITTRILEAITEFNNLADEVRAADEAVVAYINDIETRVNDSNTTINNNNSEIKRLANELNVVEEKNKKMTIDELNIEQRDYITSQNESKIDSLTKEKRNKYYFIIIINLIIFGIIIYNLYNL